MLQKITISILLLLTSVITNAQTQFWSDTFEDTGAPSSGARTPSSTFSCGGPPATAYFFRCDGSPSQISLFSATYSGIQGTRVWAAEDVDKGTTCVNNSQTPYQNITWSSINISGKTGLSFKGLFAIGTSPQWDHFPSSGSPIDFMLVEYRIDGGAWTNLVRFFPNIANSGAGQLALELTGDSLAQGEGAMLTNAFTEFSANVIGTGTTLDLRFKCEANGVNEELAIDNFRLFETVGCTNPTIGTQPTNKSVCFNSNTSFSIAATGASSYQWQENTGSGFTNITNGGIYSGATTSILNLTGVTSQSGYLYRCIAVGTGTCQTTSNSATLTVSAYFNTSSQTNVSCNGGANGSATLNAAGGIAPYNYSWSPSGGTGATASGLSVGIYTVTVTDAISCSTTKTYTITQPTVLVVNPLSQTNIACNGGSNGAASVSASGGTTAYSYNWTPGNPTGDGTASVTGLTAGNWTCTVTDANSCTSSRTFAITQPALALSASNVVTNVSCNGGSNGTINLTPAGGTSPYTFNWCCGITTEDRTGLVSATYNCTVTDNNGCTTTSGATITQPASALSASNVVTNISCFGGSNGTINLTPAGGTAPYTFNWGGGITTEDRTGLLAGAYTCTITDANGCTTTSNATITQPASALSASNVVTNISCFGGSNGAINLTPVGGTAPYTFNWGGGITAEDRTGLLAGAYTCTITDANGCTTTSNATVTQPSALITSTAVANIACNGDANGVASIANSGGTGGYTYVWSNGASTAVITGLLPGVYTATVTDANGCMNIRNATITQPSALVTSTAVTNILCNGGSNGSATLTASGGTTAYTYLWSTGATTSVITGQTAGVKTATVTDANGCTSIKSISITQPASALSASNVVTNISCFGGSNGTINLTPAGGTAPYTFNWGGGITTEDRTGLLAGAYTCTITDANGCTTTSNATITQPASAMAATISSTNTACLSNTGIASVIASGGTPSYSYAWSPSGGTAATATGLGAGTYSCLITDANSCSITKTVSVNTASGPSLTSASQTNISCFGGSNGAASVNAATGGTTPYTYNWTPGNPTGDGTTSVTGLTAQVYTCTVTDANGCSALQTFNITQPASALATSTAVTNVLCFSNSTGSATITATGGTTAYTYLWSTGATTSVIIGQTAGVKTATVTDANGCTSIKSVSITQPASALATSTAVTNVACFGNSTGSATVTASGGTAAYTYLWSTGATTSVITSQASGTKSYTVTDANGCTSSGNAIISQPASALVTATAVTNVLCNGNATGAATITATGGTASYSYLWSTGATTSVIASQTAGVKTATVTDANGCTSIKSVTISQPISALATSTAVTNVLCNGNSTGSATITVTGGTASYSYVWSTSATTSVITSQASGTKSYTVTDANGCTSSGNAIISQPSSALATSTAVSNVLCNGGSTGSATVTATGGTASYSYLWSTGATTSVITSQAAGVKTATVTDANGCTSVNSVTILEPTLLTATTSQTNTTCNGVCDGSAIITPNGGTAPYIFNWSNGNTASTNSLLCAGNYTVIVTDANGCSITQTVSISEPSAIVATSNASNILCNGASSTVTVSATGGTGALNGTGTFTELAGSYTYTITDANSCLATTNIVISEPTTLIASVSASAIACNGGTTQINFVVTGGTSPYIGDASVIVSAGTYTYLVSDANGCSTTTSISITEPLAITNSQTVTICNGQSLTVGSNTYTASGTYTNVLQSLVNGCDSTLTTELTILPANTHTQNITLCFGQVLSIGSNTYNASGTYTDVLVASNGCDSTLTTVLVINSVIDVTTTLSGLTISANQSSATYQWIDCDNSNQPIASETNQSFTASANGNYAVIVTQNSCSDTSACVNISTVGIKEVHNLNGIKLYPNPTNSSFIISGIELNTTISIYNTIGELMKSIKSTDNNTTVDLSDYSTGIYLIKIKNDKGEAIQKLIKQ